jgi:glycerol-3-phosphate dehydrogenase (NAD(P)+)
VGEPAAVAIIGAGSWGTALAVHLGRLGGDVRLWARDPVLAADIAARRENGRYLAGIGIPDRVRVTPEAKEALAMAGVVVVAVPSHGIESTMAPMMGLLPPGAILVSAAKGFEPRRARRLSELLGEMAPGHALAVLSGPSFAREVALGRPTALVIAAADHDVARTLQRQWTAPAFRLYTNADVAGVELGGALKNVIAIATGLSDGLDLGENARAALITRGLAEIARLGAALGAQPATFSGLAGIGDLVLTCTGSLSRNRALGRELARGRRLADVEAESRMVAEGVRTVASALRLAREAGVPMPICQEVGEVLFSAKPPADALGALLARDPRPEEEAPRRA